MVQQYILKNNILSMQHNTWDSTYNVESDVVLYYDFNANCSSECQIYDPNIPKSRKYTTKFDLFHSRDEKQ